MIAAHLKRPSSALPGVAPILCVWPSIVYFRSADFQEHVIIRGCMMLMVLGEMTSRDQIQSTVIIPGSPPVVVVSSPPMLCLRESYGPGM